MGQKGTKEESPAQRELTRDQESWLAANKSALDAWNDYVEKHGLPLSRHRSF
jgi:post-segregation antitoxin (ccd killing protein)